MESIITTFSVHGTLVQPESLEYILTKENPKDFSQMIANQLTEYPLVLTIQIIKEIEEKIDQEHNDFKPETILDHSLNEENKTITDQQTIML